MTPLHLAAETARVKVIEYLVGKEADIINSQDQNGVKNITTDFKLRSLWYCFQLPVCNLVRFCSLT